MGIILIYDKLRDCNIMEIFLLCLFRYSKRILLLSDYSLNRVIFYSASEWICSFSLWCNLQIKNLENQCFPQLFILNNCLKIWWRSNNMHWIKSMNVQRFSHFERVAHVLKNLITCVWKNPGLKIPTPLHWKPFKYLQFCFAFWVLLCQNENWRNASMSLIWKKFQLCNWFFTIITAKIEESSCWGIL